LNYTDVGIRLSAHTTVIEPSAMPRDFFDPTPEQQNVILVDAATLRESEKLIESCEACNAEGAGNPVVTSVSR
jgi:hypothetical protein